jgi:hypothetical protein|tara:strand:- start:169 stop:477 length:309 start_codon:yes stop_codon:yes gene_type:complete
MDAKELANEITNYLNTYGNKSIEFNEAMSREHRTLQQNFTRLCLGWIEHCASDDYRTDGRNEASQNTAKAILEGFEKVQAEKGYDGDTLQFMSKLSGHLPFV